MGVEQAPHAHRAQRRGCIGHEGVSEVIRQEAGFPAEAGVEGDGGDRGAVKGVGSDEDVEEEEVGAKNSVEEAAGVVDGAEVGESLDELGGGGEVGRLVAGDDGVGEDLVEVVEGGGPGDDVEVEGRGPAAAVRCCGDV